jgi:hypothetical protein
MKPDCRRLKNGWEPMPRRFERRLAAAERRLNSPTEKIIEILIEGGLPGPRRFASVGGRTFKREFHETLEVFRARVRAVAIAQGAQFFAIGVLPNERDEDDWSRYAIGPDETFSMPPKPAPPVPGIDD